MRLRVAESPALTEIWDSSAVVRNARLDSSNFKSLGAWLSTMVQPMNGNYQYSLVFCWFAYVVLYGTVNGLFAKKKWTFPAPMSHMTSIPDF